MLKLKLRGEKWHVTGRFNGQSYRKSTGFDKSEKAAAEDYLAKLQARLVEERIHGERRAVTFAECADHYSDGGGEDTFLDPLIEELGDKKMHEITGADLQRVCKKRYPKCKPASWRRFVYTPVSAIYRKCAADELCDLKIFKAPDVKTPPVDPAPEEWLSQFIRAAVDGTNKHGKSLRNGKKIAALVLCMSFTGARVGEAVRLLPSDLEEIEIGGREKERIWYATLRMTKTGLPRRVALHPVVVAAIGAIGKSDGEGEGDGGKDGEKTEKPLFGVANRWAANQAIKRICVRAKIPYYSSHKLGRHAFAKRLLDEGHTLAMVQEAGGWLSFGAVSRNYKHLEKSAANKAVLEVRTKLTHNQSVETEKTDRTAA